MTGLWQIVVPSAGVNYAKNPSSTKTIAGSAYSASSGAGSVTRTGDAAMQGFYGVHVAKTGTTGDYGVTTAAEANNLFVSGQYVTMSIFITVPDGTRATFTANVYNPGLLTTSVSQDGPYTGRLEATVGPLTGNSTSIFARTYIPATYGDYIYVDGFQIEADTVTFSASTFFDGDTEGCYWNGLYYDDRSIRPVTVRDGGVIKNFDDYGLYITSMSNIGMPQVQHNMDNYALQDGALYRDSHVPQRVFTLTSILIGTSFADLHDKRRALLDLLKPDVGGEDKLFWLRYTGSGETLQIKARYDSGLEYGNKNGFCENLSLRFIADDPYWRKPHNVGTDIATILSSSTENNIATRTRGQWSGPGSIDDGIVFATAYHEGTLYMGGSFTTVDGDGDMSYIVKYNDADGFTQLGTGANGNVKALLVTPDGDLYAGGAFTVMGGVANTNRVARWDDTVWNPLGTGCNGDVEALAYSASEDAVYIGGAFTTLDGDARPRIARWDIQSDSNGAAVSSGADNNIVYDIAIAPDGDVYIAGTFTSASSVSNTLKIARYDGTIFNALSTGITGSVFALEVNRNGHVFIGGSFTVAGGVTVSNITEWNGTSFLDMNGGLATTTYSLYSLNDTTLVIGKSASYTGGAPTVSQSALAYWNESTFYMSDFNVNTGGVVYAITSGGKYELAVGGFWGSSFYASATTITNNGTRTAYPRINIQVAATVTDFIGVQWIESYESGGVLVFNPLSLTKSEFFIIDTRPGSVSLISNASANRIGELNRASILTNVKLIPGASTFLMFGLETDPAEYEISVIWNELFWSADGY